MTAEKTNILLIDDDEDDYIILSDTLSEVPTSKYRLDWADGYKKAWEMINNGYDVCLMDYRLGEMNGIELMQEFRKNGIKVPIILLTGQGDHDIDIQAMNQGAVDYLEKTELKSAQLDRSIRYAIRNNDMLKALKKSEDKLRILSAKILEAQENERKLVARELHDSIGSGLAAVRFALEQKIKSMAEPPSGTSPPEAMTLERIMDLLKEIIEESHRISSNLRPSMLDTLGLISATRSFCKEYQNIYKAIRVETQFNIQEEEIPEKLKIVCYRIIQEALNNAAKHSQADELLLRISKEEEYLGLLVKDNGKGFDVKNEISNHSIRDAMGLEGMIERVKLLGGEIDILSVKGKGTTIKAHFPVLPEERPLPV